MDRRQWGHSAYRSIGAIMLFSLLLLAACGGPLPGSPKAKTILSASEVDRVNVLPDGRRIIFWPRDATLGLMMLDVYTGERVQISKDIDWAQWLDHELLYGYQLTYTPVDAYYAINLQPVAVVRLEALTANTASLSEYIEEADSIYAVVTGALNEKYLLLLLRLDANRRVVGGYAVYDVRDPDTLLAGHPYKTVPPRYRYSPPGEEYPSPDGKYYYICDGLVVNPLRIYSQQGELLNFAGTSGPESGIVCYGWAWDGRGVFFQEISPGLHPRIGPLQLLEVHP